VLAQRPDDVDRAFVDAARAREPSSLVRLLLKTRCAHREVGADELERLAQSRHHEGVVVFAAAPQWPSWTELLETEGPGQLVLTEVGLNPHNLGAITRTAGHFGVRGIGAVDGPVSIAGAAGRIAEGAAEHVPYARIEDGAWASRLARAHGWTVVATDGASSISVFDWAPPEGRVLWLLGQEGRGLSEGLRAEADVTVGIPGTGVVESLNVSVAAGVLLAQGARNVSAPLSGASA
jgi:TrmH RNA methyltransferase